LDVRAPDAAHQLLFVRPAELVGATAMSWPCGVVDAAGEPIAPPTCWAYRDRLESTSRQSGPPRHMEDLFRAAARAD
jgi:hypothetical protein